MNRFLGMSRKTRGRLLVVVLIASAVGWWQWGRGVRGQDRAATGPADPHAGRAAALAHLERTYPLAALGLLASTALGGVILVILPRRFGRARAVLARGVLLGSTIVIALVGTEVSVGVFLNRAHRAPRLAMISEPDSRAANREELKIVVVGESSAEGVPYRDWLSVGKIVAWQLRMALPQRMVQLEVQARPGWTLEQMHQKLAESRARPDAVILYAGHNEFASRYGWSEAVPYYQDDPAPWWPVQLGRLCAARLPLCRFIAEARNRELVAALPPEGHRPVVDAPSHSAYEHVERLDDFRRRLEMILSDLNQAGVLTILIVPPGNDAGFEPNRSVLPPQTVPARSRGFRRRDA